MNNSFKLCLLLCCCHSAWSATLQTLWNQPLTTLQFFAKNMQPTQTTVDFNHRQHIRYKQLYQGYPVWGGDVIMHVNHGKAKLNGQLYQNLDRDLKSIPAYIFKPEQAKRALDEAIQLQRNKVGGVFPITSPNEYLTVYIDRNQQAHWAFVVNFLQKTVPSKPTYILDAQTFKLYLQWEGVQTLNKIMGGGFGGNLKTGKRVYDSQINNLPALSMERHAETENCFLKNKNVSVVDLSKNPAEPPLVQFKCQGINAQHNNIYWDADHDAVNGSYSPSNDALYAGKIIYDMYQDWYQQPVLTQNAKALPLIMRVHDRNFATAENAYWDGVEMTFGDGGRDFYPMVSLEIAAHEISHGFTEQHANLLPFGQAGAINEAFSDMAAKAAEYYVYAQNHWQIGEEIVKNKNSALRYMDEPTKDCKNRLSGRCSIDNLKDYQPNLDVHFAAGIFNKAFVALAKKWNTHLAFNVMVQANSAYWVPDTTFFKAACGVRQATFDYQYNIADVDAAMLEVGILLNNDNCPTTS